MSWTQQSIDDAFPGAHHLITSDLDGDGRLDVVAASQSDHLVSWWRNGGGDPIAWTHHPISTTFTAASSVDAADLDGDGDQDILSASCANPGGIAWWRNDGGDPFAWTEFVIEAPAYLAHWVHANDMDGDGDTDVVGAIYGYNRIYWWRNEGGDPVEWTAQLIAGGFLGALVGHSADIDGDGDIDVLGTAANADDLAWFENGDGLGTSWTPHVLNADFPGAWAATTADLDGDGDLDLVATAEESSEVAWFQATEFTSAGTLTSSILDTGDNALDDVVVDWDAVIPEEGALGIQVRSGIQPADMGEWSEAIMAPGSLGAPLHRFVQYRVNLTTANGDVSPVLSEFRVLWTPTTSAIENGSLPAGPRLRVRNPSFGASTLQLDLDRGGQARVTLHDVSGRLVKVLHAGLLPGGRSRLATPNLNAGVYLCRIRLEGEEAQARLVVMD